MESDRNRRAREEERKANEQVVGRSESRSQGEENVGGRKCTTEEHVGKCHWHIDHSTPPHKGQSINFLLALRRGQCQITSSH